MTISGLVNLYGMGLIVVLLVLAVLLRRGDEPWSGQLAKVRVRVDSQRGKVAPPPEEDTYTISPMVLFMAFLFIFWLIALVWNYA